MPEEVKEPVEGVDYIFDPVSQDNVYLDTDKPETQESEVVEETNEEVTETKPTEETTETVTKPEEQDTKVVEEEFFGADSFENIGAAVDFYTKGIKETTELPVKAQPQTLAPTAEPDKPVLNRVDAWENTLKDVIDLVGETMEDHGIEWGSPKRTLQGKFASVVQAERAKFDMEQLREEVLSDKKDVAYDRSVVNADAKYQENMFNAVKNNGWRSNKELGQALFDPKFGGDLSHYLFKRENRDKSYASTEEYKKAWTDWSTLFFSDPEGLRITEKFARAMYYMSNKKTIVKQIRDTKGVDTLHKARAKTKTSNTRQTGRSQPKAKPSSATPRFTMDSWMHNKY